MNISEKFKVDFIVIGVQKSGTTAIDHYLREHSQIEMSNVKETHFFDNDSFFERNKPNYNVYHNNFDLSKKGKTFGEITPSYIYWNNSIKRIKEYNPNIKIISILRNPIERAYSHWNMSVKKKRETKDFITCIKKQELEIKENKYNQNLSFSYVDRGLYLKQIKEVFHHFSLDKVMFIKYEDFLSNQEQTLKEIFTFLNH
ncbi:MAG: sulfotransferase [Urechidicola sp.]|nr:sulfotransferase [Urechidicola sp.]